MPEITFTTAPATPAAPAKPAAAPTNLPVAKPAASKDTYTPAPGRSALASRVEATREELGRGISNGLRRTLEKAKQVAVWTGATLGGGVLGAGGFFGTIAAVEFTIGPVAGQGLMMVAVPLVSFGAVLLGGWLAKKGMERLVYGAASPART